MPSVQNYPPTVKQPAPIVMSRPVHVEAPLNSMQTPPQHSLQATQESSSLFQLPNDAPVPAQSSPFDGTFSVQHQPTATPSQAAMQRTSFDPSPRQTSPNRPQIHAIEETFMFTPHANAASPASKKHHPPPQSHTIHNNDSLVLVPMSLLKSHLPIIVHQPSGEQPKPSHTKRPSSQSSVRPTKMHRPKFTFNTRPTASDQIQQNKITFTARPVEGDAEYFRSLDLSTLASITKHTLGLKNVPKPEHRSGSHSQTKTFSIEMNKSN